jgi:16S rRNA (adenine1518-N6/adenine1519-N6)-dimethyltransferase
MQRRTRPGAPPDPTGNPERARLEARGIRPSKRLGQNFLLDPRVPREIVGRAAWSPETPVLEIGAGGGALTAALLEGGRRVLAVELDAALASLLEERFAAETAAGRFQLEAGDVRQTDLAALASRLAAGSVSLPWVAGNLPYAVTTPILLQVLAHARHFDGAVLMVQREYGERMLAASGTDAYSSLSVRVAAQATARPLLRVGRSAFWPRPGVESVVIELRFPQPPPYPGEIARLERVLRAAFGQRRKTLGNALAHGLGLGKEAAAAWLRAAGCDPEARAETLPLERFAALADLLPDRAQREP